MGQFRTFRLQHCSLDSIIGIFILITIQFNFVHSTPKRYIQIPEPDGLYYYPYRMGHRHGRPSDYQPVYVTESRDELGQDSISLRIANRAEVEEAAETILLQRNKYPPDLFVYSALEVTNG
jgi:hypothetical protein